MNITHPSLVHTEFDDLYGKRVVLLLDGVGKKIICSQGKDASHPLPLYDSSNPGTSLELTAIVERESARFLFVKEARFRTLVLASAPREFTEKAVYESADLPLGMINKDYIIGAFELPVQADSASVR